MNRRGFLLGILAAAVAPAIVRADALMRVVPRETSVLVPANAFTLEEIDSIVTALAAREGEYLMLVHPSQFLDLKTSLRWQPYDSMFGGGVGVRV